MFPALYSLPALFPLFLVGIFLFGIGMTWIVREFARRQSIVDVPKGERKIHKTPTALLGGVAVILTFVVGIAVAQPWLLGGYLLPKHLIGVVVAAALLLIGGALDDKYDLPPHLQVLFPVVACLIIIASGIGIDYISSPFGGVIRFDEWTIQVFSYQGTPYFFTVWADLFTFVWLMIMIYTTKFLDGMDGLVSSISIVGLTVIAALSLTLTVWQPETAMLALIAAVAFAGFLVWNWHPASIFLGESGSTFAGFILGVLAIISGGKIATALLVLGIPLLDVVWVIVRRVFVERRSPFQADRKHLHLRLLDAGFSQQRAVGLLVLLTAAFGTTAIFAQSIGKIRALAGLAVVMLLIGILVVRRSQGEKEGEGKSAHRQDQHSLRTVRWRKGAVIVFFVLSLLASFCWYLFQTMSTPNGQVHLTAAISASDDVGSPQVYIYDVARTPLQQARGYMWRKALGPDEGMIFYLDRAAPIRFWMKNTYVPLDIVWVRNHQVVGVTEHAEPQGGELWIDQYKVYPSPGVVDAVIEVPAGQARVRGLVSGAEIQAY